ncbi:YchJ family protein [Roseibium sediminicola]|uniref:YchJ family protein n=1 Tax=Roseibium sediminicola TaxID=2933272 RepID=A0ABT0GSF9_9HYPH|nr:YchJ family protein [Roseibium sp. CAU 1639]MCK7612376.1 YchJ family protein [Roseibium sp. CAU 1639]
MTGQPCPCGSGAEFELCCGPYVTGQAAPKTAEALMRSRYTAYVRENIAYLKETLWPKYQASFDGPGTARWAAESHWTGLKVLETDKGSEDDRDGTVLFEARYLSGGQLNVHRENSRFRKKSGRWYYVEAVPE